MSFDITMMLYKDMVWLTEQTKRPVKEFADVASKITLPDDLITRFWKVIATQRNNFTLDPKKNII